MLLRFRSQETVVRKVSLKRLGGSFQSFARRIKIQDGRANHAIVCAAREEMGQVKMIGVGMGL
jgi:hypothetical protein